MTLSRTNPLPLGLYWIDVWQKSPLNDTPPPKGINGDFELRNWFERNPSQVVQRSKQEFATNGQPLREFVVFQVLATPSDFPFTLLGFPTQIRLGTPAELEGTPLPVSDDTVQKPPPEDAVENLKEYGEGLVKTAGLLLGGYLLLQLLLNRRN